MGAEALDTVVRSKGQEEESHAFTSAEATWCTVGLCTQQRRSAEDENGKSPSQNKPQKQQRS